MSMEQTAPSVGARVKTPAKKEELETIKLRFTKQKITVTLDFDVTWEEALDQIAAAVGRRVYFSWTDLDETVQILASTPCCVFYIVNVHWVLRIFVRWWWIRQRSLMICFLSSKRTGTKKTPS